MPEQLLRHYWKDLATTYSRGSYTTTTIGNAAFDCRVRDGIGSDRSFIVTKKIKEHMFSENYTQKRVWRSPYYFLNKDQAARPISISPLNASRHLHA